MSVVIWGFHPISPISSHPASFHSPPRHHYFLFCARISHLRTSEITTKRSSHPLIVFVPQKNAKKPTSKKNQPGFFFQWLVFSLLFSLFVFLFLFYPLTLVVLFSNHHYYYVFPMWVNARSRRPRAVTVVVGCRRRRRYWRLAYG